MKIQTDRLIIRSLMPEDWNEIMRIANDFRKSQYAVYDILLPSSENEMKYLVKQFAESHLWFLVLTKHNHNTAGYINFHVEDEIYDMGFCFHSDIHGNSYAYEACRAVTKYLIEFAGVKTFTSGTALKNIPACRLLMKLGFKMTGTERVSFRENIVFDGGKFILNIKEGGLMH